jgi:hypothetical protein
VNVSGRVVVFITRWTGSTYELAAAVSTDFGATFADPVILGAGISQGNAVYEEADDGTIWFGVSVNDPSPPYDRKFRVYNYIVGTGITLVTTQGTNLYSPSQLAKSNISIEENKIAFTYRDIIGGVYYPKLLISIDGGQIWDVKDISTAKNGLYISGPVCISNGNILVFARNTVGSYYGIHRSTDNGAPWTRVYEFNVSTTWYMPYADYGSMRSDGAKVAFTNCAMTILPSADHNTGYLKSNDAGATWAWIEMPQYLDETVVPM